jgi:hypothetical protein
VTSDDLSGHDARPSNTGGGSSRSLAVETRTHLIALRNEAHALRETIGMLIGRTSTRGGPGRATPNAVRRVAGLVCAGAAIIFSMSACGSSNSNVGVEDPGFTAFLQDCKAKVGTWRNGQIFYPSSVELGVGESASYRASIDVGQTTPGPPKEIPGNATRTEPIVVQCAIAARLVPVGAVNVDPPEWSVRAFTPAARVDWSWTVSTDEAKDQQLRLEIQPAISGDGGFSFVASSGPQTASYMTNVTVKTSFPQRVNQYISDNKVAALGIGAAILAILAFAGTVRKAVLKVWGRSDSTAAGGDENDGEASNDDDDTGK